MNWLGIASLNGGSHTTNPKHLFFANIIKNFQNQKKPTNLNEEQWVAVRTQRFKDWFGDWELGAKEVQIVKGESHDFKNFAEAKAWAKENIARIYTNEETEGKGEIRISNNSITKYLSESSVDKSDSKEVHLSVLKQLPQIIKNSIIGETHADYEKGNDGARSENNKINENVSIHRLFGAVNIEEETYRVKVTLKEYKDNNTPTKPHSYEATKIELLAGTLVDTNSTNPNTNNSITGANLLNGVEKSYEKGKYLLDHSKVVDDNGEPLVVYHGTNAEFTEFDINTPIVNGRGVGNGFYFTSDIDIAKKYAGKKGNIKKAFLNLRNNFKGFDSLNKEEREIYLKTKNDEEAYDKLNIDGFIVGGQIIVRNPSQIKSATDNVGTYSEDSNDIRYHKGDSQSVNELFNKELEQLRKGQLPAEHIFQLGTPNAILQSAGLPNLPIEMSATRLKNKAKQENHPFDLSEVENLPQAIQNPIAVFSYGNKDKAVNIITELQDKNGKKYLVGVHFNQERKGLVVNDIRGIFPKDNAEWLNWITQNKALYINKEKVQDLITQQQTNLADVSYLDLNSIANVINNFKNPKIDVIDYQIAGEQEPYFSVLPINE